MNAADAEQLVRRLRRNEHRARRVFVDRGDRDSALADLRTLDDVGAAHIAVEVVLEHQLDRAEIRAGAAQIPGRVERARADVERELLGVDRNAGEQRAAGERGGFHVVRKVLQHLGDHLARARRARFEIMQGRVVDVVRVAAVMVDQHDVLGAF